LQTQRRIWKAFQRYHVVNLVVSTCVVTALGLNMFGRVQRTNVAEARSAYICSHADSANKDIRTYAAEKEEILLDEHMDVNMDVSGMFNSAVMSDYSQQCIADKESEDGQSGNRVLNELGRRAHLGQTASHFVSGKQTVPIAKASNGVQPGSISSQAPRGGAAIGTSNPFPFGQCVWWADQRYYQLHGIFVPWRTNAMAANWVNRAREFGWHVSGIPKVGSIMVLQPGVQGAYSAGHVAVVEQLLSSGSVIASSMNWGSNPTMVTDSTFHLGPGVAFISQGD
jgi:surface antigen